MIVHAGAGAARRRRPRRRRSHRARAAGGASRRRALTYLLGQMLEARGRYQEIVDFLKPEIAQAESGEGARAAQIAMLLGSQGLALQQLQRYDEAIAAFKEARDARARRSGPARAPHPGLQRRRPPQGRLDAAEKARAKFPEETTVSISSAPRSTAPASAAESEKMFRDDHRRAIRSTPARSTISATCWPSAATVARRGGHADPARAQGRARQPVVPRQPRLGLRAAGQARSRRSRR